MSVGSIREGLGSSSWQQSDFDVNPSQSCIRINALVKKLVNTTPGFFFPVEQLVSSVQKGHIYLQETQEVELKNEYLSTRHDDNNQMLFNSLNTMKAMVLADLRNVESKLEKTLAFDIAQLKEALNLFRDGYGALRVSLRDQDVSDMRVFWKLNKDTEEPCRMQLVVDMQKAIFSVVGD